jgi:arsenite methyltransferase
MRLLEISKRYSELATYDGCPTFEEALNYREAKPGEVCVEIGSGEGTDAIRLAETVGRGGFVYGIEMSESMIEKAAEAAERSSVSNLEFINCTPEKIKLNDDTADLVISNCTINYTSDKQSVWNEIYRILKRGGRFVVSDMYSANPSAREEQNYNGKSVTRDGYLNQLENAGFSTITILDESIPYSKDGRIVANWTIAGQKPLGECSWCD